MGKPTWFKGEFDILVPYKNGFKLEFNHNKNENEIGDWYMTMGEVNMTFKQFFHGWEGKYDF